jgi:allantoicase
VACDGPHAFRVSSGPSVTRVTRQIFADGGVARLRVHGEVVPDPAMLEGLDSPLYLTTRIGYASDERTPVP